MALTKTTIQDTILQKMIQKNKEMDLLIAELRATMPNQAKREYKPVVK